MAVAVRSATHATTGNATSLAVTKPTGTTSGDVLLAVVWQDSDGYTNQAALQPPASSGWLQAGSTIPSTGTSTWGKVFYKVAGGSEPASYTFALASGSSTSLHLLAISGANTGSPLSVAPAVTNAAASTSMVAPSISVAAGDLLVCSFTGQSTTALSWTPPGGMTEASDAASSYCAGEVATEVRATAGATGTRTATANVAPASNYNAISLAISGVVAFSGSATATLRLSATRTGGKAQAGATAAGLRLTTSATGAHRTATSPSGLLRLSATRAVASHRSGSPSGVLRLSGVAAGERVLQALLRLSASIPAYAVAGRAAVTAALHLGASATAAPTHRSGTPTAATVRLTAARAGAKRVASAPSVTLRLAATPGTGAKRVAVAPLGLLRLSAVTSGGVHTSGSAPTAVLLLAAVPGGRVHTTVVGLVAAMPLRLSGEANAKRIFTEAAVALRAKASLAVSYELVCVARIPATQGTPTFLEVDPIDWSGLSYTDELSKPQQLSVGCQIAGLTDPILQRLRDLADLATELWLYRDGVLVFAGPLLGWQVQSEALTLNAQGLLAYLNMMVVQQDLVYKQQDQFTIAAGLIDQWQALDYGNFGIDTSTVGTSGVKRDATYLKTELHNVGQRVFELGQQAKGFDLAVNPKSRKLELSYPTRGIDRSSGEDAIVFDARNVTSPNIVCSAAPGDVASEAFVTGTAAGGAPPVYATASNLELRAKYGRTAVTASYQGVSEQTTANGYATALEAARGAALLVPGPDVRVTPDADLRSYDVGDTVAYTLHEKLSVSGSFRLRRRQVTVSQTGQETVSVQFV